MKKLIKKIIFGILILFGILYTMIAIPNTWYLESGVRKMNLYLFSGAIAIGCGPLIIFMVINRLTKMKKE